MDCWNLGCLKDEQDTNEERRHGKTCCFVSALVRQESTDIYGRFCAECILYGTFSTSVLSILVYMIYIYFLTSGSVHVWKLVG